MEDISAAEVTSIRSLKNNNAGGLDEMLAELTKHGWETVVEEFTYHFNLVWKAEDVPDGWERGAIVKLQ